MVTRAAHGVGRVTARLVPVLRAWKWALFALVKAGDWSTVSVNGCESLPEPFVAVKVMW